MLACVAVVAGVVVLVLCRHVLKSLVVTLKDKLVAIFK